MSDIDNLINLPGMPPLTDSQLLARWAAEALQERRWELAQALTRLAGQAARMERDGHAENRIERNIPYVPTVPRQSAGGHDAVRPAPSGPVAGVAAAAVYGRPGGQHAAPEPAARCEAMVQRNGMADPCRAVVTWADHTLDGVPGASGWAHLDPELEIDHPAIVAPGREP